MAGAAATAFALAQSASPSLSQSHSRSRSSSPSSSLSGPSSRAHSPRRARSPSLSGDTDDLMSDDDQLGVHNNWGFDSRGMETVKCEWGGEGKCGMEWWEVEPLVEHVHSVHAFPDDPYGAAGTGQGKKGSTTSYICDWAGCPRRGKTQGSKFALVAHLRSHTGEKPFHCPKPECDKSFTRTDALQKHMRVQHNENPVVSRPSAKASTDTPGGGGGAKGKGKKKRGARAASDESAFDGAGGGGGADDDFLPPPGLDSAGGAGGAATDGPITYSPDEVHAHSLQPHLSQEFVGYVVVKAKQAYLMNEHEGLLGELEALEAREADLRAEVQGLVGGVMRKELGTTSSAADQQSLETFLTAYDHTPARYPSDFGGK